MPLALDVDLDVSVGDGYVVRGAYGSNGWVTDPGGGSVHIPSLFLAGRTSAGGPVDTGRGGGGGAILVELVPRSSPGGAVDPRAVGQLDLTWKHPHTGETRAQHVDIAAPSAPSEVPAGGYFTDSTVEKGFVMLNLFAGFRLAAGLARDADPPHARDAVPQRRGLARRPP